MEARLPKHDKVAKFRFGFVEDPMPGHESYKGMLAIPYLRRSIDQRWSTVAMRFRCVKPECLEGEKENHVRHGKYMSEEDGGTHLFNTVELENNHDVIYVTEGEFDAVMATVCDLPAVGVPGVKAWKPFYRKIFIGYEKVVILADNDKPQFRNDCTSCGKTCRGHNPGMEFADKVKGFLKGGPQVLIRPMAPGHDVSSMALSNFKEFNERTRI